ncbi:MAG: DUF4132 domain-containing protein [Planctomycetes bacterium]|nr:DUF4132 domain-containing protein [Planctomycetota bacterium]
MPLDWLKGLLRRNDGAESPPEHAFLRAEAQRLASVSPGLAERAERYLTTGEGDGVLGEIRASPQCAEALELKSVASGSASDVRPLDAVPHDAALVRLGRMYAAASPTQKLGVLADAGVPAWLEVLIFEGSSYYPSRGGTYPVRTVLPLDRLRRLLRDAGESEECLARMSMRTPGPFAFSTSAVVRAWDGRAELLASHPRVVATSLDAPQAADLVAHLKTLREVGYDVEPVASRLAELASDERKSVREAAQGIVRDRPAAAVSSHLRHLASEGSASQRFHAWETLAALDDAGIRDRARAALGTETAPRVRKMLDDMLAIEECQPVTQIAPPPQRPVAAPGPLNAAQRAAIRRYADETEAARRKLVAQHPQFKDLEVPVDADAALASIADPKPWSEPPPAQLGQSWYICADLESCVRSTEWELVHLLRFAYHALRHVAAPGWVFPTCMETVLTDFRNRAGVPGDLRELAEAATWLGYPKDHLARRLLEGHHRTYRWGSEAVWPYFAEHVGALTAELGGSVSEPLGRRESIGTTLEIVAEMPYLPDELATTIWRYALGTTKTHRAKAQRVLAKEAGTLDRILLALDDGRQEVRATAAEWLGTLGDTRAAAAIEKRLRKESSDLVRALLLTALEDLGRPIDAYLDRRALAADARKGLGKVATTLAPVREIAVPTVRWQDTGAAVDADIVSWWLVKAAKLRQDAPDPLLRRYVGLLVPADRHALGEAIVSGWIAQDTRPPTEISPAKLQELQTFARQYHSYVPGVTLEQYEQRVVANFMALPIGSAIAWKGCLAVAGACGGPRIVEIVERYLRQWYGMRSSQSKALLSVLAWMDEPAATQLLLATATRFRTAGIQKEAERLVREVADRRGWTLEELADRTLPDAGFDSDGSLVLEFLERVPEGAPDGTTGSVSRRFVARLLDDLSIALDDADGKRLKALPNARTAEDEASVAAAKKALAAARTDVQKIVRQQRTRLYEAMCAGRSWSQDDWRRYLLGHPVVGRLCRRVIWRTEGDAPVLFRPLDDGSLTSVTDDAVTVDGARIRIAHGSECPPDTAAAWSAHFADFEVEPLVEQFPQELVGLPKDWKPATEIDSVRGHIVRAFALRSAATRRDYMRGSAEDGGWFLEYRKNFPALGVAAVVTFTGNGLPETDRDTALLSAHVEQLPRAEDSAYGPRPRVALGSLSPILLAELRADLAALAAAGTGHDPDWEARTAP